MSKAYLSVLGCAGTRKTYGGLRNEGSVVGSGATPLLVAGGLSVLGEVALAAGFGKSSIALVTLEGVVRQKFGACTASGGSARCGGRCCGSQ